jgi:predicted transport protein
LKNFACVVPFAYSNQLVIYAKVDPSTVSTEAGFTRDVSQIGHWGTGDVEITLRTMDDFEKAKTLLLRSYEAS